MRSQQTIFSSAKNPQILGKILPLVTKRVRSMAIMLPDARGGLQTTS